MHYIHAASIPVICLPLVRPNVPSDILASLKGFDLANSFNQDGPLKMDILIGLDFFWCFMLSKAVHMAESRILQSSVFGMTCSGSCSSASEPSLQMASYQLLVQGDVYKEAVRKM